MMVLNFLIKLKKKLNFLNWEIWSNLELKAGFHMIATIATISELVLSDRSFHSDRSDHIETSL